MWRGTARAAQQAAFTRISVTSTRDYYLVREGDAAGVRVWVRSGGLRCECGRPRCRHIASLVACGFVEDDLESAEAA